MPWLLFLVEKVQLKSVEMRKTASLETELVVGTKRKEVLLQRQSEREINASDLRRRESEVADLKLRYHTKLREQEEREFKLDARDSTLDQRELEFKNNKATQNAWE